MDRGLTQHQVSKALEVNRNFVYEVELNRRTNTIYSMHKICTFLGYIPKTLNTGRKSPSDGRRTMVLTAASSGGANVSDKPKKTIEEDDISTERTFGRRSTIATIGATVVGAAAVTALGAAATPESAKAQTDSDGGRNADAAGHGRTGVTDSDGGSNADRAGHGRGRRRSGCTDSDGGRHADAAGNGRCNPNCSDPDGGRWADPAGRGRRC